MVNEFYYVAEHNLFIPTLMNYLFSISNVNLEKFVAETEVIMVVNIKF